MSHVFKSGQGTASQVYKGIRVTTAQYGQPLHIVYGRTRVSSQLIYAGNFQTHNQSGKKNKGNVYYTVDADYCMGYGPMQGIGSMWIDRSYSNGAPSGAGGADPYTWSQSFFVAGPTSSATVNVTGGLGAFSMIVGVTVSQAFSVTYNDYGGSGSASLSGTTQAPLYNNLYPAPNNGTWANAGVAYAQYNSTVANPSVTVLFPSPVTGVTITVYFRSSTGSITDLQANSIQFEKQLGSGTEGSPITYPEFSGFGMVSWNMQSANVLPNFDMEPFALYGYGQHGDCNPADVIIDLICSGSLDSLGSGATWNHGLGLTSFNPGHTYSYSRFGGILQDEPNLYSGGGSNLGLNAVRNYCQANGIGVSMCLDAQDTPSRNLDDLCEIANCAGVWDGAQLWFIPYSEVSTYGNGASYVAPTASGPVFAITTKDFLVGDNEPPVTIQRARPQDNFNSLPIEFSDRSNMYNVNSVTVADGMDITIQGSMPGSSKSYHGVKDSNTAQLIGRTLLKRNLTVKRRTYKFKLPASWVLAIPMDLATIYEPGLGSTPVPVRFKKITENADFSLDCEAEPFFYGASAPILPAVTGTAQPTANVPAPTNVTPGSVNAPIIFEAVPAISSSPQLWFGLSGSAAGYGGCHVWISTDGGTTYSLAGTSGGNNTMGVTYSATYPNHADPDATNTLNVDLTGSRGSLSTFTTAQRDLFTSLCYLNGGGTVLLSTGQTLTIPYELVAYATATLAAANKYALPPTIRRGVFGTPTASHAVGTAFSFLNDGFIFKLNLPQSYIGQTLWFKFTAFNVYGQAEESLASVTAYSFAPTGLVGWSWSSGGTTGTPGGGPTGIPTPTGSFSTVQSTSFTGNGSSTTFTLPITPKFIEVFWNGEKQLPTKYSFVGTTLTTAFTDANGNSQPADSGDTIDVVLYS